MPQTYKLDGIVPKPIGLKLFGPGFNVYIVEGDSANNHEQCFGYVENLMADYCSEWGYININEYITTVHDIPVSSFDGKSLGTAPIGFEQDLYFENRFIDQDDRIFKQD